MRFKSLRGAPAAGALALVLVAFSNAACTGAVGSPRSERTSTDSAPPGIPNATPDATQGMPQPPPVVPGGDTPPAVLTPAGQPLRRLTNFELKNTLVDLLGVNAAIPEVLPRDVLSASGFLEGSVITRIEAEALIMWTDSLAQQGAVRIIASAPCATAPVDRASEDECARGFISNFGMRAFRRPLTDTDSSDYFTYYRDVLRGQLGRNFEQSIRGLAHLMLQSPRFLYHAPAPRDPATPTSGLVRLDDYELASRMAYFLSGTMPDPLLFEAASSGRLSSVEGVRTEAQRILSDPKSTLQLEEITLQWLGIENLRTKVKAPKYNFTPELGDAMVDETRRLVASVLDGDGTLSSLLLSRNAYVENEALAALYGQAGVTGNPSLLKETERSGILTRAAFLTTKSLGSELNPIKRGLAVVAKLMCLKVPPPPDGFVPPDHIEPGLSTREFLERHDANVCAAACHAMFTPAGLTFENYDGIGAYRTLDGAVPVDATASVYFADGTTRFVGNALELSQMLAADPASSDCFSDHWFRRAMRRPDTSADQPYREALQRSFRASNGNIRELMVALATSEAFTHRRESAQ